MPGPLPKAERRRRNVSLADEAELAIESAAVAAPDFGDLSRLKHKSREWLVSVVTSAQAEVYQPSDWQRVRDVLQLREALNSLDAGDHSTRLKYASEIRQLEGTLLMTHKERVSAGVKVQAAKVEPAKAGPADDAAIVAGVF
ncbi:hypothetical protein [Kitasatospora sp. NPDC056184]|uniref:phage terminase small subunit n=1 Tax=Kitasatospora sp. NPDC056184 TaxID=3345738 RepID=UPI0035DFEF6D